MTLQFRSPHFCRYAHLTEFVSVYLFRHRGFVGRMLVPELVLAVSLTPRATAVIAASSINSFGSPVWFPVFLAVCDCFVQRHIHHPFARHGIRPCQLISESYKTLPAIRLLLVMPETYLFNESIALSESTVHASIGILADANAVHIDCVIALL